VIVLAAILPSSKTAVTVSVIANLSKSKLYTHISTATAVAAVTTIHQYIADDIRARMPVEHRSNKVYTTDDAATCDKNGSPSVYSVSSVGFRRALDRLAETHYDLSMTGVMPMPIGGAAAASAEAAAALRAAATAQLQKDIDAAIVAHGQLQVMQLLRYQKLAVVPLPSHLMTALDEMERVVSSVVKCASDLDESDKLLADAAAAAAAVSSSSSSSSKRSAASSGAAAASHSSSGNSSTATTISSNVGNKRSSSSSKTDNSANRRSSRSTSSSAHSTANSSSSSSSTSSGSLKRDREVYEQKARRVDPIGGSRHQLRMSKLQQMSGPFYSVLSATDTIGKGLNRVVGLDRVAMMECTAIWGGEEPQEPHCDNSHHVVVYRGKQVNIKDPLMLNWLVALTDAGVWVAVYPDTLEGLSDEERRKRVPVRLHIKKGWALCFHHLLFHLGLTADGACYRLHYYGAAQIISGDWVSRPFDSSYKDDEMTTIDWEELPKALR
jgi:hypothetical protein